jgi:thiol-disulfide isomerase/thioredoxin
MTKFFTSVILFVVLAFALSALTSCSDSVSSKNDVVAEPQAGPSVPVNAAPEKKKTDYPPIATAVAQADIKQIDGTVFKVADKKGKVILLNMWATWCGPCRAEMPALVRMQEKHRDAGFEVVGLDTDPESVEEINDFASQMKLNYTLAWADTDLQAALLKISKFGGIPQSFIIDRDGNLRGVFRGAGKGDVAKMEELVDMIVAE